MLMSMAAEREGEGIKRQKISWMKGRQILRRMIDIGGRWTRGLAAQEVLC